MLMYVHAPIAYTIIILYAYINMQNVYMQLISAYDFRDIAHSLYDDDYIFSFD